MIKLCAFADEADNSIEGQIDALKSNGISLIELRNVNGKNIIDITKKEAEEYRKKLNENGIGVWSIGSPLGKIDIDCDFEEYKEKIKHICELANIFGCNNIRMFSFFKAYECKEKVFEYLNFMTELAKQYSVTLCHENEKDIYGDILERVEQIYNNVNGIKLIFDPANYVQCGQDVNAAIKNLERKTYYYHIKDALYTDGSVVPPGCGDGEIKRIIERLDTKTETVFTVEPHLKVFEGYSVINGSELKNTVAFNSNREAFDFAVAAFKKILTECNYIADKKTGDYSK